MVERKVAIVWPGQGIQEIGMGSSIPHTILKPLFELGSEVAGIDLYKISKEGPVTLIHQTHIAQMLVTIVGLGHWAVYCQNMEIDPRRFPKPDMMAGHSVAEVVALIASGAITKEEAFPLVWQRGNAMHKESGKIKGGMYAVLGKTVDSNKIFEICAEFGIGIANENSPQQIVVAGPLENLAKAKTSLEKLGYKCLFIPVEGAFHTLWMNGAYEGLLETIKSITFKKPLPPIYSNLTGELVVDPEVIKGNLPPQVINRVRWQSICESMIVQGVVPDTFKEQTDPGKKVLTRLFGQTYEFVQKARSSV